MMRLKGKKAIITGGGRGIGRAIALSFAREGADLVITYVSDKASADETLREIYKYGGQAIALPLNLGDLTQISQLKSEAIAFLGKVDILVNNAGFLTRKNFLDIAQDELFKVLNINLTSPFILLQQIAAQMQQQNTGGSIINVSSISDRIASNGLSHYQCAKAGLSMLTKGAALELAQYGIRVNTISPGLTATDINRNQWDNQTEIWRSRVADIPLKRAGLPEDHVGAAIFLASDESAWMTGACLVMDGGRSIF